MTTDAKRGARRLTAATPPTPEEIFLSHSMGNEEIVSRQVGTDGTVVTFNHKGAQMRVLYAPTTWGWESVQVPASNVMLLLASGMRVHCGDCGGDCSPDPMAPTPNACTGRPKFATSRCPICRRIFHDFAARVVEAHIITASPLDDEGSESTEINQETYSQATPSARLKALSDQHILAYHPADAPVLGLEIPDPRLVNQRA